MKENEDRGTYASEIIPTLKNIIQEAVNRQNYSFISEKDFK
jgi:hypothetical protein